MEFKPLSVNEYLALEFPENDIISGGILTRESRLVIAGHPGLGKSVLCQQICYELSKGLKIVDKYETKQANVLYIQEEVGDKSYQIRLKKINTYYNGAESYWIISTAGFSFDDPGLVQTLKLWIAKLKITVVAFDPLYKIHGRRENDPTEMSALARVMDRLIHDTGISIILVHHLRKPFLTFKGETVSLGLIDLRGAIIKDWADTCIQFDLVNPSDKETLLMSFVKTRNAVEELDPQRLHFDRPNLRFSPIVDTPVKGQVGIREAVLMVVNSNGGVSVPNLQSVLKDYGKTRIKQTTDALKADGLIDFKAGLWVSTGVVHNPTPTAVPDQHDAWDTEW